MRVERAETTKKNKTKTTKNIKQKLRKTENESCERFAIIDQEIIWYGEVNLLAKSDGEQSIMRVPSKSIASELMELTFGKE